MAVGFNVKEISEVKQILDDLQGKGFITEWELPYKNILTRLSSAIFFCNISDEKNIEDIKTTFQSYTDFCIAENTKSLSLMKYMITFSKPE